MNGGELLGGAVANRCCETGNSVMFLAQHDCRTLLSLGNSGSDNESFERQDPQFRSNEIAGPAAPHREGFATMLPVTH